MRFLVDACVDVRVSVWLKSQTHDATHLRDEGLQRLANGDIFTKAMAEQRVIVTFDLDFSEIVALAQGQAVSVLVFRLRNTRVQHVIDRFAAILPHVTRALDSVAVVTVEESRYRVRHMPIGRQP